jgi:hypothetical protein
LDPVTTNFSMCCVSSSAEVGAGWVWPRLDAQRNKDIDADRIAQHLHRVRIM